MPKRLQTRDSGFEAAFAAFLGEKREASDDVGAAVATILADVRARGDAALIELSKKFDRVDLGKLGIACHARRRYAPRAKPAAPRRWTLCRSRPTASPSITPASCR